MESGKYARDSRFVRLTERSQMAFEHTGDTEDFERAMATLRECLCQTVGRTGSGLSSKPGERGILMHTLCRALCCGLRS